MGLLYANSFDRGVLSGGPTLVAGLHGNGATGTLREPLNVGSSQHFVGGMWFKNGMTLGPTHFDHGTFGVGLLSTNSDGSLQYAVTDGAGTAYYSAVDCWRPNVWHFVEIDVLLGPGELTVFGQGAITVWLDDPLHLHPIIDEVGKTIDEAYVNAGPPLLFWGGFQASGGTYDELYIANESIEDPFGHVTPADPLGPIHILGLRPNGVGDAAAWTPDPVGANWTNVDDVVPDGDTTVNVALAEDIGAEDLHALEDVSTGDTILAQYVTAVARKSDSAGARLTLLLKHDGVTYDLDDHGLTETFAHHTSLALHTMPNGDPLTDANLNAQQVGYRREA